MRKDFLLVLSCLGITLACRDEDQSPTAPDTSPAAAATASALQVTQVSVGILHACGVASDNQLYCWGVNSDGELGDGTTANRSRPVPVGGSLRFRQVSAGFFSTCAVTTGNRAYCWGENDKGQLGDGTTSRRLSPVPVTGGRQFRRVEVGSLFACAVTASGDRAFCWGDNRSGQLGIGNNTGPDTAFNGAHSTKPIAVAGTLTFRHVSPGDDHACGVTTDNRVYCWGSNRFGQLGDSSTVLSRFKPTRVAGTRQYRQVDAGLQYTCAVSLASKAFCWGNGLDGHLGNGKTKNARYPQPVSGGHTFDHISAGASHACAETTTNRAYCWGVNHFGALGDGTQTTRLTPVAVSGGLSFTQVSAGDYTCGITSAGRAYCWGVGSSGELGTGTNQSSAVPVPVADPAGTP